MMSKEAAIEQQLAEMVLRAQGMIMDSEATVNYTIGVHTVKLIFKPKAGNRWFIIIDGSENEMDVHELVRFLSRTKPIHVV